MPENVAAILVQIVPLVLIFVIFYFVLIRPQRRGRFASGAQD